MKFTEMGRTIMDTLVRQYRNTNNADKVYQAMTKRIKDIPNVFEYLKRFESATKLCDILDFIVTPAPVTANDIEVVCGPCEEGVIKYIAGNAIHKCTKQTGVLLQDFYLTPKVESAQV